MVNLCRHIRTSGTQCGMVALRHQNFCYYHRNSQPRPHRSTIRTRPHTQTPIPTYDYGAIPVAEPAQPQLQPPVQLLFPEDRASIQINLYRIAVAQAGNRIDTRTANSMTWNQQVCMANLGRQPLIDAAPATVRPASSRDDDDSGSPANSGASALTPRPVSRVILTPEGDEIAPPLEILEDNEAEPIHHRGCPCLLCAEQYRNHPPELHHPDCQCGLCEEAEESGLREQGTENPSSATTPGDPGPASGTWAPYPLHPKPRVARASSLLSGSATRDTLNRPWSIAEYTFGDAIRRHEAQYAARAAAALAVGIEPPPYEPYVTGLIHPGTPEYEEEQQMQQHSSEYWAAHFRQLIADRDIQQHEERAGKTED